MKRPLKSFLGTVPTSFFFGLQESLRLMEQEEGLENVFARHTRLAQRGAGGGAALVGQQRPAALLHQRRPAIRTA